MTADVGPRSPPLWAGEQGSASGSGHAHRHGVGPLAVRASKKCAIKGLDIDLENAMRLDEYFLVRLMQTEDIKESPRAFLEKRKPEFKGR